MGKSLKRRLKRLLCCYTEESESSVLSENLAITNLEHLANNNTTLCGVTLEHSDISDSTRNPEGEVTKSNQHGITLREEEKSKDCGYSNITGQNDAKCSIIGIGRKISTCVIDKDRIERYQPLASSPSIIVDSFIAARKVTFPSFNQTSHTYQGRRYDWTVVNSWSRHMAEASKIGVNPPLLHAHTNLNISEISNRNFEKTLPKLGLTDTRKHALTSSNLNTCDPGVRPKAARHVRTKHCFTDQRY